MEWYFILVIIALTYVAYLIFTSMAHFLFKLAVIVALIIFLLSGIVDIKKALDVSTEAAPLPQLEQVDEPAAPVISNETEAPLNIINSSG